MLQVPGWVRVLVALILLWGIAVALPNALPQSVRDKIPTWLPHQTVSLGLDLQGGSYLLLEVQLDVVVKDKLEGMKGDIRGAMRKIRPRIPYEFKDVPGDAVAVLIKDPSRYGDAKTLIQGLNPTVGGGVLSVGTKAYDFSDDGHGLFTLRMTDTYKLQTDQEVVNQSIEVVRRRVDPNGTREMTLEREGDNRIVLEMPGLKDPQALINMLGKTAKMSFQLVDEAHQDAAQRGVAPIGDEILPMAKDKNGRIQGVPLVLEKRVIVAGDRLVSASQSYSQNGEAAVSFRFDSIGAKEFGDVTKMYPSGNQRFAIVLDKEIISAPAIREPILGGQGEITGSFTADSARDLATLLQAGALPAPLKVVAQSSVGSELGEDQINAGRLSAIAGLVLVALFMIARYGLFGLFADIALVFNIVLLLAALTLMGATLTLPGIAGIVLTMGMAVDANVLIYERMREEQKNGRSMLASIDQGFRRAMATIIDANSTHLIAALILFELGSGPVRGFAVTLGLGIATSFFTAVMVTRLIVIAWLNIRRPRKLAI